MIRDLPENTVHEYPNSSPESVFPAFPLRFGTPTAVVYAWSGGAYDPRRHRLLVWGGGHNDYNGNELYAFPVYGSDSPAWTLLTQPSTPPASQPPETSNPEYADGTPASCHTYNMLQVDPVTDTFIAMGLGSVFGTGSESPQVRALDLATNTWQPASGYPVLSSGALGSTTAYDHARRVIYRKAGGRQHGLDVYNIDTRTVTTLDDGLPYVTIDLAMDMDPDRGLVIALGGYDARGPTNDGRQVAVWDIASATNSAVPAAAFTPSGFPSGLVGTKLGLAFHPPSGSFVAYGDDGTLFRIIPPTNPLSDTGWTFQQLAPQGPELPDTGTHGTYSRWRWAPYPNDPTKGVFVVIQATAAEGYPTTNVFIFKPGF